MFSSFDLWFLHVGQGGVVVQGLFFFLVFAASVSQEWRKLLTRSWFEEFLFISSQKSRIIKFISVIFEKVKYLNILETTKSPLCYFHHQHCHCSRYHHHHHPLLLTIIVIVIIIIICLLLHLHIVIIYNGKSCLFLNVD